MFVHIRKKLSISNYAMGWKKTKLTPVQHINEVSAQHPSFLCQV